MQESGVLFVAIGRLEDRSVLYHFCFEEKYEEAQSLLVKFHPMKVHAGDHQKLKSPNGSWYSTFDEKRITYMALCSDYYSETQVYRMLSEIQTSVQEEIPSYWEKSESETTAYANTFVPEIAEKFKDLGADDNLIKAQTQLDQVRLATGESVRSVLHNVSNLENIEEKSQKLSKLGERMSQGASELEKKIRRRKLRIRLIMLGTFLMLFVFVYFAWAKSSGGKKEDPTIRRGS